MVVILNGKQSIKRTLHVHKAERNDMRMHRPESFHHMLYAYTKFIN